MEIRPNIHRVSWPLQSRPAYSYVFNGERVLVVDSGLAATPQESLLPYLRDNGIDPERVAYVLTTHCDMDHAGGNAAARRVFPNARLICHELDRSMVEDLETLITGRYGEFEEEHQIADSPDLVAWYRSNAEHCPVDIGLVGGETLRLAADWVVEVLHTPGHTLGSISVRDPLSGAVVIGDAVLGEAVPGDAGPAMPPTYRYTELYRSTIQTLQILRPEVLLTAHYPVMEGRDVVEFLATSEGYTRTVERALLRELSCGKPLTLKELIARLGSELGAWPRETDYQLAFPFAGHLEQLESRGVVRVDREKPTTTWILA